MVSPLRVHLGRDGPKSVELEETTIEVTGDFVVEVENHGPPQHLHIAPAADLARFATVAEPNHFIEADDAHVVAVDVSDERPQKFDGQLRIVTGYGTEEFLVDVKLRHEGVTPGVAVDASLGKPRDESPAAPTLEQRLTSPGTVPLIALAVIATFIAIGAALVVTELAVVLGALAVLVGVGIAIVLLVR